MTEYAKARNRNAEQSDPANQCSDHVPVILGNRTAIPRLASPTRVIDPDPLGGTAAAPEVVSALRRRRGAGRPLPEDLAEGFGAQYGANLSNVRLHTDTEAARIARSVQAVAFTHGADIYFGQNAYSATTEPGRRLLAHELAHVADNKTQAGVGTAGIVIGRADDPQESRADKMADHAIKALRRYAAEPDRQGVPAASGGSRTHAERASLLRTGDQRTLRRIVSLNGESRENAIWAQVAPLLKSRYRRKQTLRRWIEDGINRTYVDASVLANDLDLANAKGGALGRGRPAFTAKLQAHFNQTWGGIRHRRHIVMSSLMREAVYATTENNLASGAAELVSMYNQLVARAGLPAAGSVAQAEANLVYVLHNNPANLIVDTGSWNSAIGAFAHNVQATLKKDQQQMFDGYRANRADFFGDLVKGFHPELQKQIAAFWQEFEEPSDVAEFTDLLETMYDNAALDLMSKVAMPTHDDLTAKLLATHGGFAAAASSGDLAQLAHTCAAFIETGRSIGALDDGGGRIYYKDVL